MRRLLRWLVAAALLVAVAVGGVWFFLDLIAARVLEQGAEAALGVDVRVGSVSLRPLRGSLRISDLEIANPAGFSDAPFLALREASAQVDMGLLRSAVVRIPRVALEGVAVELEMRQDLSNYGVILANAERATAATGEGAAADASAPGPSVRIDDLVIRDVRAAAGIQLAGVRAPRASVAVPEIRLRNLGSEEGAPVSEIVSQVVRAVLDAVAKERGLPREMLGSLRDELAATGGNRVLEAGREAGRALGEAARGIADGIGGLLGRSRER